MIKIKRLTILALTILAAILLFGCSVKKYDITTTMYYQYDFTRNIVKDKLSVGMLTKPGTEAHDFEPTSRDIQSIKQSKLFIFTGFDFDMWLNGSFNSYFSNDLNALNVTEALELETEEHEHEHEDEEEHIDSHFWTSPLMAVDIIKLILEQVILIDPDNSAFYQENADAYITKILTVHTQLEKLLKDQDFTIYFAGHNALGAFAEVYGINVVALSNTAKPDADITSAQLLSLVNQLRDNDCKFLFIEEIKQPKIAQQIKAQIPDLTLLELHSYHNVTLEQFNNNVTYYDLFYQNYQNILLAFNN